MQLFVDKLVLKSLLCLPHHVSSLHQATVNMFYFQRQQTEPVPLGYHNLELTCRSLEPGEPYLLYVLSKRRPEQPPPVFTFQEYVPQGKGYGILTNDCLCWYFGCGVYCEYQKCM